MKSKLFDDWADSYNESVKESDQNNTYPFSGYRRIQEEIYTLVTSQPGKEILEMGIGTGEMMKQLYKEDYSITGVDFSIKMVYKAQELMPNNKYVLKDFKQALVELKGCKYDVILFSYSIHHLSYDEQLNLLAELHDYLQDGGCIIIGDVMAETTVQLLNIREDNIEIWDDEEFYPVYQMVYGLSPIYDMTYLQVSFCSGVMTLTKK